MQKSGRISPFPPLSDCGARYARGISINKFDAAHIPVPHVTWQRFVVAQSGHKVRTPATNARQTLSVFRWQHPVSEVPKCKRS
jgi:hypothetical protein